MYSAKTEMHRDVCRKKLLYHLCRIHERGGNDQKASFARHYAI